MKKYLMVLLLIPLKSFSQVTSVTGCSAVSINKAGTEVAHFSCLVVTDTVGAFTVNVFQTQSRMRLDVNGNIQPSDQITLKAALKSQEILIEQDLVNAKNKAASDKTVTQKVSVPIAVLDFR